MFLREIRCHEWGALSIHNPNNCNDSGIITLIFMCFAKVHTMLKSLRGWAHRPSGISMFLQLQFFMHISYAACVLHTLLIYRVLEKFWMIGSYHKIV
jgi:hypothetical protein